MKNSRVFIEKVIKDMDTLLEIMTANVNEKEFGTELINATNKFIDYFVMLSTLNLDTEEKANGKLSECLVEIIDAFNVHNIKLLEDLFNRKLLLEYGDFKNLMIKFTKSMKYKIIVCGFNQYTICASKLINSENAQIMAYVDYNNQNIGKYFCNKIIISMDKIKYYDYDYLFLMDNDGRKINYIKSINGITDNCIIDYVGFINHILTSPEFFVNFYDFINEKKNFDGIITGISYAKQGINANTFKKKFFNLAAPCQDLYYDYEIMKFALKFKELKKTIKYAIIGLCYYSFQYDLSKSLFKDRVWYYYHITNTIHNYKDEKNIKFFNDFYNKAISIINEDHFKIVWDTIFYEYYRNIINESSKKIFNSKILTKDDLEKEAQEIKKTFNKDYPLTVEENKKIFKEYLEFLIGNKIKPIVIVCPQTKIYSKNTSQRVKNEFENIICEFKEKYNFQFIDYSDSSEFTDADFMNSSHLNKEGSIKFTEILEREIQW